MPTVPTYTAPSVSPSALPAVRDQVPYHLSNFAGQAGREAMQLAGGALRMGDELLEEATRRQWGVNEAAVKDYDAKLMSNIQAVLYGTPDKPDAGYMAFKGKNAVDSFDATSSKLQGLGAQLAKDLQNPAQQEMARQTTATRVQSALTQAAQHRDQQHTVWQKAAGEVRIQTAQQGAPLAYSPLTDSPLATFDQENPAANSQYQQYLQTIKSETRDYAQRFGMQDVADDLVKNNLAKAYGLTLAHLIDRKGGAPGDMAVAKKFFEAVKGELPAETQDKARALLEAGSKKDQALKLALEIKGSIGGIDAQEKELDKRFSAEKIDSEVHQMALQHLRADNAQRRAEQGENDKAMIGAVWDLARKGGSMTDLSPSQIAYIKQRGLGPHIDAMFKNAEKADFDDSQLYSDLMRMSAEDPAGFTKMELATLTGKLTKAHWNHLIGVQASLNRNDLKVLDTQKLLHDTVQSTRAQLLAAGMNLSPKPGTEQAKQLDQFNSTLYDALTTAQKEWDEKKLTRPQMREEARKLTLGLLKDQALAGTGFFGTTVGQSHKPVWKMTAEERAAPWDIPATERKAISDKLKAAGLPASEENIQTYFKLSQGVR